MVAPWDIYAEKLFPLGYGHPLWIPEPSREFGEVRIGDIGYLSDGRFCFLFNCIYPTDDPINTRGTPVDFQPLEVPSGSIRETPDEITQPLLQSEGIHSVTLEGQGSVGLADNSVVQGGAQAGLRYRCTEQSGAILMLNKPGHGSRLHCTLNILNYMRTFLPDWHAFATGTLGIDLQESDIIFVYGHTKTTIWAEAAFSSKTTNGELFIATGVFGTPVNVGASGTFSVSLSNCQLPTLFHCSGPQGRGSIGETNQGTQGAGSLPDRSDQCIFVNYFKMKRTFLGRKVIRAAAGPHQFPRERDGAGPSSIYTMDTEPSEDVGQSSFDDIAFDPVSQLLEFMERHSQYPKVQAVWASDQDVAEVMKRAHKQETSQPLSAYASFKAAIDALSPQIMAINRFGVLSWANSLAVGQAQTNPDANPKLLYSAPMPHSRRAVNTYRPDLKVSPQRSTQIRAEIRRLVRDALSQITSSSASMKWNREAYMKDVVSRYRVRIEGWPHDRIPFKNLSDIQNLSELEMLLRGWEDGFIRFVHITEEQYQAMLANPAPWVGPVEADED